jgi:hypothetical protein
MMERLAHFGYEAKLSAPEVTAIRNTFAETYAAAGGPPMPDAAVRAFTVRFALRDVLDTLTALRELDQAEAGPEDNFGADLVLHEQLDMELELLKRALGWAHE